MSGWGGKRQGAGRKVGWRKEISQQRPQRQLRAHQEEWDLIKDFMYIVREIGIDRSAEFLNKLKAELNIVR